MATITSHVLGNSFGPHLVFPASYYALTVVDVWHQSANIFGFIVTDTSPAMEHNWSCQREMVKCRSYLSFMFVRNYFSIASN